MNAGSDENVVREAWRAFSRGDMDALLSLLQSDIEVVPFGAAMEGKAYRGHDGVREWYEQEIIPNWEIFEVHPEEFRLVGEKLLVLGHWKARGRTSGVELDRPATWVMQVRDGKIVSWTTHTDRDEALRAVGLTPGRTPGAPGFSA